MNLPVIIKIHRASKVCSAKKSVVCAQNLVSEGELSGRQDLMNAFNLFIILDYFFRFFLKLKREIGLQE